MILRRWLGVVASLSMLLFGGVHTLEAAEQCGEPRVAQRASPIETELVVPDLLTIASLNIAAKMQIGDVVSAWMGQRTIDVLLLQEVGLGSDEGESLVAALSTRLGFHYAYARSSDPNSQGLAIVSRYPLADVRSQLLKHHQLRFRSRCRIALAATVMTGGHSVRVTDVHLDTRINSDNRVAQLSPVLDLSSGFDGAQIIGGDLNTMNIGWFRTMWPLPFLQRQATAVRQWFASVGYHTPLVDSPATFRVLGLPLKLDWLYLKRLEPIDWGVDPVKLTDHRGVWLRVKT